MRRPLATLAALLTAPLPARAADEVTPPPLPAHLAADVTAAAPGAPFHVGVVLEVPAGWHVYWQNPGDSGLATAFDVVAPAGATVGPVAFPGPERFDLPGGIVNYGYAEPVALVREVTLPAGATSPAALTAAVRWLLCREACVPGGADLSLALPVAPTAAPSPALDAWLPLLPTPFPGAVRATPDGWRVTLPGATLDAFFPLADGALPVPAGRGLRFPGPADGVVRAVTPAGPRYHPLTLGASP